MKNKNDVSSEDKKKRLLKDILNAVIIIIVTYALFSFVFWDYTLMINSIGGRTTLAIIAIIATMPCYAR